MTGSAADVAGMVAVTTTISAATSGKVMTCANDYYSGTRTKGRGKYPGNMEIIVFTVVVKGIGSQMIDFEKQLQRRKRVENSGLWGFRENKETSLLIEVLS